MTKRPGAAGRRVLVALPGLERLALIPLLAVLATAGHAAEPPRPAAKPGLVMLLIRVDAGPRLAELRTMPLDIVRVRASEETNGGPASDLRTALVVEAVADRELAAKLERMGYEVKIVGP